MESMKKICIDARMWGIKHTGIGRYVENLVDNLPGEVILIVHPDQKNEPKLARFKKYYAKYHPYSVLAQLEMLILLIKIKPDLVHFSHFSVPILWRGKFVVTIHDLIKHYSADQSSTTRNPLVYLIKQIGYRISVWNAIKYSQKIIVPANYWKKEISRKFNINSVKISVTYEGVFLKGSPFKAEGGPLLTPYLMYVGNLYPHKNIPILIEAVERLKIHLKIACARNVFENRLPKSEYTQYLGMVSDDELATLYKNALCFVFPSKIEGFGLTGLEAMSQCCPVIAANASCLPEIYGDAALYFDPNNVNDLVSKIQSVLSDKNLMKSLVTKGKLQVKKYSWATMANQTWEIYQNVLR